MIATTRGALFSGQAENDLGDMVDDNTDPVRGYGDFAVGLLEKRSRVVDPETGTWREIIYLVARVPINVPAEAGDRLRDNRTGELYAIDRVRREPRSLAGRASLTLTVRRTSP